MINIRRSCFETNSSSMHSLTILNKGEDNYAIKIDDDGYINITFGEFGWEVEDYDSLEIKLQYILTMIMEIYKPKTEEEFYKLKDFKKVEKCVCDCTGAIGIKLKDCKIKYEEEYDYVSHEGYIDHQSVEDYSSIDEFLKDNGVELDDYLFNSGVILHTDNDNRDDFDWDWEDER